MTATNRGKSPTQMAFRRLRRNVLAMAGAAVVLFVILLAFFPSMLVPSHADGSGPYEFGEQFRDKDQYQQPPGIPGHPLGTDELGRDVLTRIIYGAGISLRVGLVGTIVAVLIGLILGSVAGFRGGLVDTLISRLTDTFFAFPSLLLMIGILAVFEKPNEIVIFSALGVVGWPGVARIVRGQVISLRGSEFVLGASGDYQIQRRTGYENFIGDTLGVKGALRRNEHDNVNNVAEYAQFYWHFVPQWALLLGLRHDTVRFSEHDFYITPANPDDSGHVRYNATTPVVGLQYRPLDKLRIYASYGKGFETPSYNELGYRSDGQAGLPFPLRHRLTNASASRVGYHLAGASIHYLQPAGAHHSHCVAHVAHHAHTHASVDQQLLNAGPRPVLGVVVSQRGLHILCCHHLAPEHEELELLGRGPVGDDRYDSHPHQDDGRKSAHELHCQAIHRSHWLQTCSPRSARS